MPLNDSPFTRELASTLINLTTSDLRTIYKSVHSVLKKRAVAFEKDVKNRYEGYTGLANFMSGVVQAMALRQLLRWSKGHKGWGSGRPVGGEMWIPMEVVNASNAFVNKTIMRLKEVHRGALPTNELERINPIYSKLNTVQLISAFQSVLYNHSAI